MCEYICCCCSNEEKPKRNDPRVSPEQLIENTPSNNNNNGSGNSLSSRQSDEILPINRTCTDVTFVILSIAFLIILAVLVSYCFVHADLLRLVNGYDDCGNTCGTLNEKDTQMGCKGVDKRKEKFLMVEKTDNPEQPNNPYIHRQCVEQCNSKPGYRTWLNRCVLDRQEELTSQKLISKTGLVNFFQDVSEDLSSCWQQVIYVCLISFVFSFIVLVLFRFVVGFVVWVVLIASVITGFVATIYLWIKYSQKKQQDSPDYERVTTYLVAAIISTIGTVVISLVIFVMRKRVKLVIQLFREAGKALTDMPLLLFEPLLTFAALFGTLVLWFYFTLMIESAGRLEVQESNAGANMKIIYVKDNVIKTTRWVNLFALLWFTNILFGCQDFIIAGSVSKWYFTRNKSKLNFPIVASFAHLIRYHMGSVCFGSLIIAILQLLRIILQWIETIFRNAENQASVMLLRACQCCLACFEGFIQYLSKNAYIVISMNGSSFCSAGKHAYQLLSKNSIRVFAINSIGDFVLLLGKIFVVTATALIAIEMIQNINGLHHPSAPIIVCAIFAFLVSHCFLTVFEMTIDTVFLCFCEDSERHDGITRPYYMSRGLMEFVQNSKEFKEKKWAKRGGEQTTVQTVS